MSDNINSESGNAIIPDENHVQLLIIMGFIDEAEVKRALRMAKNDVNEAISLLTNELPGLHDIDMSDAPTTSSGQDNGRTPSSNPASVETTGANGDDMMDVDFDESETEGSSKSLEFPATHLYNLEERVYTSQWNIPYRREESLGRCLLAATRLAKVGLADSDENCRRFVEQCLPECFQKLLMSLQVNRWNIETQDGIYVMLQLFIDLVATRLTFDPVPLKLMDILAVVFDPFSQYNQKNSRRLWDRTHWEEQFGDRLKIPSVPPTLTSSYDTVANNDGCGLLVDLINRLAVKGGLDSMVKKIESGKLEAQEMYALLRPLANCAEYLNQHAVGPLVRSCCEISIAYIRNLNSEDIKKPNVHNYVVDLLGLVGILQEYLMITQPEVVVDLRLDFIQRLLRSSHFGSRMQALKEVSKLLDYLNSTNKQEERLAISAARLSHWLSEHQILSLALEGNIDQAQYCDRLRTLLTFLGPRLSCQDIGKIWSLRKGRTAVTVDNVHNIIAQAASKFSKNELEHLLTLIKNSWKAEGDRSKDKLLLLLGVIGRETSVSSTYELVADYLWEFAHQNGLSEALVTRALEEHLSVVSGFGRETCRSTFIQRCLSDMRDGHFFLPAMGHLHAIVESVKKNTMVSSKHQKTIIADLVNNKKLVETLCDCLVRIHAEAVKGWKEKCQLLQQKPIVTPIKQGSFRSILVSSTSSSPHGSVSTIQQSPMPLQRIDEQQQQPYSQPSLNSPPEELGPDYVLLDGYTLGQYVDGVLAFLRFILNEGELFLLIHRCRELWDTLIADDDACRYEREAGFTWFSRGLADLEKKCQQTLFEERMLVFDPLLLTPTGFECFRKYFESVNGISGGGTSDKSKPYFPYSTTSSYPTTLGGMSEIDKTDLIGLEYLWQAALNSPDGDIARQAVDMIISVNYTCLANRLKKDPATLHRKFLNECYRRLEGAVLTFKSSPVANLLQEAGRLLAAPSFPALYQAPPPDRTVKVRNIERLLLIAEQYVKTVEAAQTTGAGAVSRMMPAHGASFFGQTFVLRVAFEDSTTGTGGTSVKKGDPIAVEDFGQTFVFRACEDSTTGTAAKKGVSILVHENEALGMVRERLAEIFGAEYAKLTLEHDGKELMHSQDQQILKRLGLTPATIGGLCLVRPANILHPKQNEAMDEEPTIFLTAKRRYLAAFVATYDPMNRSSEVKLSSGIFSAGTNRQPQGSGQESALPAVMMAQDRPAVFDRLHQLVQLDEPSITSRVRELLLLIPSDSGVVELLDTLMTSQSTNLSTTPASSKSNSLERSGKSGTGSSTSFSEKIGNMLISGSSSSPKLLRITRDKDKEKESKVNAASAINVLTSGSGLGNSVEALKQLFDLNAAGSQLTPFRVLYNLEILSGRLLPTSYTDTQMMMSAQAFAQAFVSGQGIHCLLAILRKEYLPFNVDPTLRQSIYAVTLQLLCYLLCNESALREILRCHVASGCASGAGDSTNLSGASAAFAAAAPPGPSSASSASVAVSETTARIFDRLEPPQSCVVRDLSKEQMASVLETLQRLCWAAAGGMLHLIGTAELKSPSVGGHGAAPLVVAPCFSLGSPRSRTSESSTSSNDGAGEIPSTLHGGVLSSHTSSTLDDIRIAKESLKLTIDCILIRPEEFCQVFFNLPHIAEFILDLLLASGCVELRRWTERQLLRLAEIPATNLVVGISEFSQMSMLSTGLQESHFKRMVLRGGIAQQQFGAASGASMDETQGRVTMATPRFILLQILLKARVPLWVPSSQSRGSAQRVLLRCYEYFSLRGRLLATLTASELSQIQPSPSTMLDDEAKWLQNFSCSSDARLAPADNALLAGHMLLITSLLRLPACSAMKRRIGQSLVEPLLKDLLFPAARLIVSRGTASGAANEEHLRASTSCLRRSLAACGSDAKAKGSKAECRLVAYDLLLELCTGCPTNYGDVIRTLTFLHHLYEPELASEWDYSPLVDVKSEAGFVGLKNAGATCYMNSVLQQFFNEPGLVEQLLATEVEESDPSAALFVELQRLMAHLRESEQQYYVPQKFWEVFRLWGQHVNPREQQDAFEFFTCLIDQVDEFLKKSGKEELFRHKYQGVFSDQKICQGCPHSYERSEAFYALNLPVRAHGLEESLNNFVKGEILEGDNAYFCEKCGQKRTALKRMCIKSLPEVTVIQLKRFGYDWEENRSLKFNEAFQFPLTLDLFPYTAAALSQMDGQRTQPPSGASEEEDSTWYSLFATSPLSAISGHHFRAQTPSSSGISSSPVGALSSSSGRFTRRQNSDKRLSVSFAVESARYELVGIVVHSGQANAGHYYAYIKDRRDGSLTNGSSASKWFKFNDTTVEMVEMTPSFMEVELFGGKYTAKVEKNSSYPEERERYWNAYLLFYHRIDGGQSNDQRVTRSASKRSVSMSSHYQFPTPVQNKSARRRDSLMELAELVEQSEQRQLFSGQYFPSGSGSDFFNSSSYSIGTSQQQWWQPPAWLRTEIQEDNFRFSRNRDVYNPEYFLFIERLVELAIAAGATSADRRSVTEYDEAAAELALKFVLNTAWHCRRSLRGDPNVWATRLMHLASSNHSVCRRLIDFFNQSGSGVDGEGGKHYLSQYFFSCDNGEVRQAFGAILFHSLVGLCSRLSSPNIANEEKEADHRRCGVLLENLLALTPKEAVERHQVSSAYFFLLRQLVISGGVEICALMLEKQAFMILLNFLLPLHVQGSPFLSRRWTLNQARDLGDVYGTLAILMLHCRLGSNDEKGETYYKLKHLNFGLDHRPVLAPPPEMEQLISSAQFRSGFVRELVWACCHVHNVLPPLIDLMLHCSWRSEPFSQRVVIELLVSLSSQPSNDLKHLFSLMDEFLCVDGDDLQLFRAETALDGLASGTERVDGLLTIIKSSQASGDGRRSYHCIKFLVQTAERCPLLKEALNKRLDRWQWAVDWLRTEMETMDGGASNSGTKTSGSESVFTILESGMLNQPTTSLSVSTTSSNRSTSTAPVVSSSTTSTTSSTVKGNALKVPDGKSNEDSTTKIFQRTVSAQYTLDQAKALFGDIGSREQEEEETPSTSGQPSGGKDEAKPSPSSANSGKKTGNSMFYIE